MTFTIAFCLYTLLIVSVGIYSARYAKRSDEDFFLAGRSLGGWVAALSASASSESGWVTLGLVGWAFTSGVSAYWIIPGCLLGFIFNWFFIAGRMHDQSVKLGALTLPDFFSFSFKERIPILRILTVIVIITAMWLYVAAQFAAAGNAFSTAFSGLPYWAGVLIGAVIVLLYTVIGGFRAACWTDFLQGLIMLGTLVAFPLYLFSKFGGYDFINSSLAPVDASLLAFWPQKTGTALVGFLLGIGALGINFGYPGQPHVLVRFMALKNRREAVLGGIVSVAWAGMVYWGAVTIGLLVRAMTEAGELWTSPLAADLAQGVKSAGENGLVLAAIHLIPGIMSGMVLAAVLAAICSTADSQLVVAASSGANDIYSRLFDRKGKKAHMIINRTVLFVLGVAALLLVIDSEVQVFKYVLTYGWAVLGGAFGPQVAILLLWKKASYAGCIAGMFSGFSTALIWPQVWDPAAHGGIEIYNLTIAFAVASFANIVFSLLFPSTGARLQKT